MPTPSTPARPPLTSGGFSATSTNRGSTVTSNVDGRFNEFEGRGGNDDITGNGNTRASYQHATSGVTVTFTAFGIGFADGDASVGHDTFVSGVTRVRGSNFNDTFQGSSNPANTTENFEGLGGDDTIHGGGGFDRANYNNSYIGTGINVQLAAGIVTGGSDVGTDTLDSVGGHQRNEFRGYLQCGRLLPAAQPQRRA